MIRLIRTILVHTSIYLFELHPQNLMSTWNRIGSLVILVHDFADHWMELAKMAKYAGLNVTFSFSFIFKTFLLQTLCDISFVIFMFMWTLRLGIFPTWIIYTTTVEAAHVRFENQIIVIYLFKQHNFSWYRWYQCIIFLTVCSLFCWSYTLFGSIILSKLLTR